MPQNKETNWITSPESKALVHQWRSEEQAILIGYNTALNDNPLLTTRLAEGKNPLRLVLDENCQLPTTLNVFNNKAETIVFNTKKEVLVDNIHYVKIDSSNLVSEVLNYLHSKNISSIIVEGGTKTLNLFIKQQLWDEARVFVNPLKTFVKGINAPVFDISQATETKSGSDLLYITTKK